MKKLLSLTFFFLFSISFIFTKESIVKIYSTHNNFNQLNPWSPPAQTSSRGSGFVIKDNLILTNAHVVLNAAFIEVKLSSDSTKYLAKIVRIGNDCDLALIEVKDKNFLEKIQPLEFSEDALPREKVMVFGFPMGGDELCVTEGIISRTEVQEYAHSGSSLLISQIDAAINPGNSGCPVISTRTGKAIGVVHQGSLQGQNIGFMIPLEIILHFLKETEKEKYFGFPKLNIELQKLENPSLRKHLKLPAELSGVLVKEIPKNSSACGKILTNDVILEIDNITIANDGTFLNNGQRLNAKHLISSKFLGDFINVKLFRNSKIINISLKIDINEFSEKLVPFSCFEKTPSFFILGGIVFQKLTCDYLKQWGDYWLNFAPKNLLYNYHFSKKQDNLDEVIFISQILPHEINVGYEDFIFSAIDSVNGIKISKLQDLIYIWDRSNSTFINILTTDRKEIILERSLIVKYQKELLGKYFINKEKNI